MGPYFNEEGRWQKGFNFRKDIEAALYVLNHSKTTIKYGEGNFTKRHQIGAALEHTSPTNPVRRAYYLYMKKFDYEGWRDHHGADLLTAYYAVRDTLHYVMCDF